MVGLTNSNVIKFLIILPSAKDRSKHLWKTERINISLEIAINLYLNSVNPKST